jgi:ferredoxin-nitrate reductase
MAEPADENGGHTGNKEPVRRLELWMGALNEGLEILVEIYRDLVPRLVHDLEVQSGLEVMRRLTTEVLHQFKPVIDRYHGSHQYGRTVAQYLQKAVFPAVEETNDPYEALAALQSLDLFLTYIEGHLTALSPASQALWDSEFVNVISSAQGSIQRQKAWVNQHIKVKSPQTLLVPTVAAEDLYDSQSSMAGRIRS